MLRVLALYANMPWRVRAHTHLRAWTCPFEALIEHLPAAGRMIEIGCGHGLFANAAALRHPRLDVLGVDPSPEKIHWAQLSVRGRPNVSFHCQPVDEVSARGFDALAILDVLYLVPKRDWPAFLRECRLRLRSGGRLLLKEVDTKPRHKFYRCALQEQLSVRLLGLTRGSAVNFASRSEMVATIEGAGFANVTVASLDEGYLTPHVLYEAVSP
jgi:2-polyprenyl-3-methyl-5-hydroxy-6-metoxy-1,4-benzoquinol methylase